MKKRGSVKRAGARFFLHWITGIPLFVVFGEEGIWTVFFKMHEKIFGKNCILLHIVTFLRVWYTKGVKEPGNKG